MWRSKKGVGVADQELLFPVKTSWYLLPDKKFDRSIEQKSNSFIIVCSDNKILQWYTKTKYWICFLKFDMLRKKTLLFIYVCLYLSTIIWIAFHQMNLHQNFPDQIFCLEENKVYIDGQKVCEKRNGIKYLSHQPPGGGWNNQRSVFENAVVLAKLLNRTLIVHPLAPHVEIRRITVGDYRNFNLFSKGKLLPLSNVMDLKLLSKLIPVKEFASSHAEFQNRNNHLRWARICHNGLLGIWVDTIPRETDAEKWRLLRRQMNKSLPAYENIPSRLRICKTEVTKF